MRTLLVLLLICGSSVFADSERAELLKEISQMIEANPGIHLEQHMLKNGNAYLNGLGLPPASGELNCAVDLNPGEFKSRLEFMMIEANSRDEEFPSRLLRHIIRRAKFYLIN